MNFTKHFKIYNSVERPFLISKFSPYVDVDFVLPSSKVLDYSARPDCRAPSVKLGFVPAVGEHPKIPETGQELIQWSFLLDTG